MADIRRDHGLVTLSVASGVERSNTVLGSNTAIRSNTASMDTGSQDPTASDRARDRAQLASDATSLAELTERIVAIADRHRNDPTSVVMPDLDEIERALRSAGRKLDRLLRRLD